MYHVPSVQHAVGRRNRLVVAPQEAETLQTAEQCLTVLGQPRQQVVVERQGERKVLHALSQVATERERRNERGERRERATESLVGRHEPAAREFRLADEGIHLIERGMVGPEGSEIVERASQQGQPRE